MRAIERPGLAGEQPFLEIVGIEGFRSPYLRSFAKDAAKYYRHGPACSVARRHNHALGELQIVAAARGRCEIREQGSVSTG